MNILLKPLPKYDPVALVRELSASGLPYWKIAQVLETSESSIKKWMCGRQSPHASLWIVAGILKQALEVPASNSK